MSPADVPATHVGRRRRAHWNWFALILAVLAAAGAAVAVVAMLPLAMATDPCHDGSPDRICRLSATGQNVLMLIPWLALLTGLVVTGSAAVAAAHRHRSPLLAIPVGILGYLAAIGLCYQLAFTL